MKISRILLLFTATIAILLMGSWITYAWFAHNASMATLMEILPPDSITIIPISEKDGSELTELDLDFKDGVDTKTEDGTITIRRPICIQSTSSVHQLEVVHTTNLKNLDFKIYPAKTTGPDSKIVTKVENAQPISGEYKNQDSDITTERVAKKEVLNNYESLGDVADVHAYPLYWLAGNSNTTGAITVQGDSEEYDPITNTNQRSYYTYYYLEISWKETTKETDLFYVMAHNVSVEGSMP